MLFFPVKMVQNFRKRLDTRMVGHKIRTKSHTNHRPPLASASTNNSSISCSVKSLAWAMTIRAVGLGPNMTRMLRSCCYLLPKQDPSKNVLSFPFEQFKVSPWIFSHTCVPIKPLSLPQVLYISSFHII